MLGWIETYGVPGAFIVGATLGALATIRIVHAVLHIFDLEPDDSNVDGTRRKQRITIRRHHRNN